MLHDMGRNIIVIGASTGGFEALAKILRRLRPDPQVCVFIVLHISESNQLPRELRKFTSLPVRDAVDREPIKPGTVVLAPPDLHLTLAANQVRLIRGPKENGFRPAIDPLFLSAAREFGKNVVGVLLSGALDDGSAGMVEIKRAGGLTIVQDPVDAIIPYMPRNAMAAVAIDCVLTADQIASKLNELIGSGDTMPLPKKTKTKVSSQCPKRIPMICPRAKSLHSPALNAAVACGKPERETWFVTHATRATNTPPRAC